MEAYAFGRIREERRLAARDGAVLRRRGGGRSGFVMTAASAPAKGKGKAVPAAPPRSKADVKAVLKKASASAFRGGVAGFAAGVVQVGTFMWMRTVMNFQYVNGGTMLGAIATLYKEGGIARFYKGVSFAIIQNPMSRFGDTAANVGVLALMDAFAPGVPVALKTALASVGGATWRIALTPVDTFKTTLQVQGNSAFNLLRQKVATGGIGQLYGGAAANFGANWVGNYPWFVTFNFLQARVPQQTDPKKKTLRNALIGVAASTVSDCVSNSLRVIKTVKQTTGDASLGYMGVVKSVIAKDGLKGLLGRGLKTRLITNICQSMVFSVAWKAIEEELNNRANKKDAAKAAAAKGAAAVKGGAKAAKKAGSISDALFCAAPAGLAGSALAARA